MAFEDILHDQLKSLGAQIAKRAQTSDKLDSYYEGKCPLPRAIEQAKLTKAYAMLMPMSEAPWGSLIVDSVQDRLEVTGIQSDDSEIDDLLWGLWQSSGMDAESKLAMNAALVSGRAFALVWPDENGQPAITLDTSSQMVVQYQEGSRRKRVAAMRYWLDGDTPMATLYRKEAIYKFQGPKNAGLEYVEWEKRIVPDEEWPLQNPYGVVPVVELAVNRRLKPGSFGYARGEYEHCTGLIDRINLLTFLGLVVAFWMGFPLRGVIGEKILYDDDNNPLPPFDVGADSVFQLENTEAKLAEYQAADRSNLSVYAELDQLSAVTKIPRHYMPMSGGMANLSASAIQASEGGLIAKVPSHQASLGEGWEEVLRLCGWMLETPVDLSQRAELQWRNHESRSLSERADAAVKLKDILPQQAIIEFVLNATAEQMARWEADKSGDVLSQLLVAAAQPTVPTVPPMPIPAMNGNG